MQPHDEIEPHKCGKVPNFAPITLPKILLSYVQNCGKSLDWGGIALTLVHFYMVGVFVNLNSQYERMQEAAL